MLANIKVRLNKLGIIVGSIRYLYHINFKRQLHCSLVLMHMGF